MFVRNKVLVSLRVYYYMPDYRDLIQEFMWQTMDIKPKYPRVNKFLNYWKENIEAVIADIEMIETEKISKYKSVEDIFGAKVSRLRCRDAYGYEWEFLDEEARMWTFKFTEDEVIEAVRAVKNEDWFINRIRKELNMIWNRKNGYN